MIKQSQLFGWEHEPAVERASAFMHSTQFGSLSTYARLDSIIASNDRKAAPPSAAKREPPNIRDQALSSFAQAWLDSLPEKLRPVELAACFPRIANRIALCWADPVLTERFFEALYADGRIGRKGFPYEVAEELALLREDAVRRKRAPRR
jgi:hypothetical protein